MWLCLALMLNNPQPITFAAGYIPNVQFIPFYVALEKGYYRDEGLELTIDYTIGSDIFKLVAQGEIDIASADPDAFLFACKQGLPLRHLATLYQNYPVALISKKPLAQADDLKGLRIGISGPYGSSYLGLKALVHQMGAEMTDFQLISIGYTQVAAMKSDRVDAVVGYANNEPVRLAQDGMKVFVTKPSHQNAFPGVGFAVNSVQFEKKKALYHKFLRATFKGLMDVLVDPKDSFRLIAPKFLPGVNPDPEYSSEYKVLENTLPFWTNLYTKSNGFGQTDPSYWRNLQQFLEAQENQSFEAWSEWVDRSFVWKNP